jgi:hypothetical protein
MELRLTIMNEVRNFFLLIPDPQSLRNYILAQISKVLFSNVNFVRLLCPTKR